MDKYSTMKTLYILQNEQLASKCLMNSQLTVHRNIQE